MSVPRVQVAAEAGLAFVFGAGWFVLLTLLVGSAVFCSRTLLVLTVIVLDVAVVWMLARMMGIGYGVAVGVAGVVALDWYCIPPSMPRTCRTPRTRWLSAPTWSPAPCSVSWRRQPGGEPRSPSRRSGCWPRSRRPSGGWPRWSRSSPPEDVFASVTEEVGKLLRIDVATLLRYETEGSASVLAAWSREGRYLSLGSRWHLDPGTVASRVWDTGRPQRVDGYAEARGAFAESLRGLGVRSSAGSPVVVEGALWG